MEKMKGFCKNVFSQVMQWTLRLLVYPAFRPKLMFASPEAKERFPQGPCVFVSNHVTMLDAGPIETLLHKKHFYGLTAADIIRDYKFIGWFLKYMPSIPIDRHQVSLSWLREGRKKIRQGHSIYLCPEGKCNEDRVITAFKPGFVTLAAAENVPVVPLYHNAEFNYFIGKRFRLMVGEPVEMVLPQEGMTDDFMRRQAAEVTEIVRGMEKQMMGYNRTHESQLQENSTAINA